MLESLMGITQNIALFFSPRLPKSISSWDVMAAYCGRLKAARRTAALTKMDFAVLPETKSQGLFHQIQKEVT
ncbi:hypothetical protein, partial [Intestinimonas butyriciproducens]|uniref:hypothetical protein n=1 Tax=Intestinimonas butyriciproducens TaxID=1297617 RepID=UPI00242BDF87